MNVSIDGNNITIDGYSTNSNIVVANGEVIINGVSVTKYKDNPTINFNGSCTTIRTTSGKIFVTGDVLGDVTNTSGDVSCQNVGGSVQTVSGDVRAKEIKGSAKTVSGDITR